jgi:transcriptional regulator with XRE-family HTH domain
MPSRTGFAARLHDLRVRANLTQAELAARAGVSLHTLTKLEQGQRDPTWTTVLAVARALRVDVGEFVVDDPGSVVQPPRSRGRPKRPPEPPAGPPKRRK